MKITKLDVFIINFFFKSLKKEIEVSVKNKAKNFDLKKLALKNNLINNFSENIDVKFVFFIFFFIYREIIFNKIIQFNPLKWILISMNYKAMKNH